MSIPVEIVGKASDLTDWLVVAAAIVQAVGSVAAIFYASWSAHRDRVAQREEAARRRYTAVSGILGFAAEALGDAVHGLKERELAKSGYLFASDDGPKRLDDLQRASQALQKLSPIDLEDWFLIEAVTSAQRHLFPVTRAVQSALDHPQVRIHLREAEKARDHFMVDYNAVLEAWERHVATPRRKAATGKGA